MVSGAVWLVLQAADMTEGPLDEAWRSGAFGTLLFETYAGRVWQIRIAVAAALLLNVCALAIPDMNLKQRCLNATGLALAGAVLISAAWLRHAGADPTALLPLHLSVHAAHMLAAASWLGGLLPFSVLLCQGARARAVTELAPSPRPAA